MNVIVLVLLMSLTNYLNFDSNEIIDAVANSEVIELVEQVKIPQLTHNLILESEELNRQTQVKQELGEGSEATESSKENLDINNELNQEDANNRNKQPGYNNRSDQVIKSVSENAIEYSPAIDSCEDNGNCDEEEVVLEPTPTPITSEPIPEPTKKITISPTPEPTEFPIPILTPVLPKLTPAPPKPPICPCIPPSADEFPIDKYRECPMVMCY